MNNNRYFEAGAASLWEINAKLGYGFILLFSGLLLWPDSLLGYGWGLLAFLMIASALGLFINAVRRMIERERFLKHQEVFSEQGSEVKASALAANSDFIIKKKEIGRG